THAHPRPVVLVVFVALRGLGLVHKVYPAPFSMNIMISLFASLQSSIIAIFFARDVNMWKLEWDVKLLAIIYSGIVVSGLTYYLVLWAISKRGPVFAAMFSPLHLPLLESFQPLSLTRHFI
nr:WAT1-related protein [Tanacetum cinerariifolium]